MQNGWGLMNRLIHKSRGFTLLEVMIAITIFALVATSISQVTSISVDNQIHLERKLLACWIAENETTLMRSLPWPDIKNNKKDIEFSDRKWVVTSKAKPMKKIAGIDIPLEVKEVSISVALESAPESALYTLTSFMAKDDA